MITKFGKVEIFMDEDNNEIVTITDFEAHDAGDIGYSADYLILSWAHEVLMNKMRGVP